jgi:hypothetical protein
LSAAVAAVLGVSEVTVAILQVSGQLVAGARRIDDGAAARMVERMRTDAPRRSGKLAAGITAEFAGEIWTVKASAIAVKAGGEGADYASFVEAGTDPRQPSRAAADAGFFAGQSRTGHPGTDPQPYFWDNAREVLGERSEEARKLVGGFEGDL